MATFIKLTVKASAYTFPTWVSVERIERFGGLNPKANGETDGAFVSFRETDENGFVHVTETPEQILALIQAAKES